MPKLPEINIQLLQFLIVDDDQHIRDTVVDVLRHFGCKNVREAEDGDAALKMLDMYQPDVILTEFELPKTSGIELTFRIRRSAIGTVRMTPIIILSAHTREGQVMRARDVGATEYLAKPIRASTIYARISSVIVEPRTFIESDGFVGPDRRRKHDPFLVGQARRKADEEAEQMMTEDVSGDITEDEIDAMLGL
ncbi:MAG: response regulator [Magnetovibrionaceae bacterium]